MGLNKIYTTDELRALGLTTAAQRQRFRETVSGQSQGWTRSDRNPDSDITRLERILSEYPEQPYRKEEKRQKARLEAKLEAMKAKHREETLEQIRAEDRRNSPEHQLALQAKNDVTFTARDAEEARLLAQSEDAFERGNYSDFYGYRAQIAERRIQDLGVADAARKVSEAKSEYYEREAQKAHLTKATLDPSNPPNESAGD